MGGISKPLALRHIQILFGNAALTISKHHPKFFKDSHKSFASELLNVGKFLFQYEAPHIIGMRAGVDQPKRPAAEDSRARAQPDPISSLLVSLANQAKKAFFNHEISRVLRAYFQTAISIITVVRHPPRQVALLQAAAIYLFFFTLKKETHGCCLFAQKC